MSSGARPSARGSRALPLWLAVVVASAALCSCGSPRGSDVPTLSVAVASNFAEAHAELARRYEMATGARVVSSKGATGGLYAQIRNGAPFHIFLSADALRPRLLEEEGLGVPGTRFTYATGRLVLYGPGLDSVRSGGADLSSVGVTNLAIANPRTAPYGVAAEAVLGRVGLDPMARSRIVQGANVGQTLQFVRSEAAELGFVALSQVIGEPEYSYWPVPAEYHAPLVQDALLLRAGEGNPVARDYLAFLRSDEAERVIESFGYETGLRSDR